MDSTITSNNSGTDDIIINPMSASEKILKYEDKIKRILDLLKENQEKPDFDYILQREMGEFELLIDEEIVSRIVNTHKLNLHLANILKDNKYNFIE